MQITLSEHTRSLLEYILADSRRDLTIDQKVNLVIADWYLQNVAKPMLNENQTPKCGDVKHPIHIKMIDPRD